MRANPSTSTQKTQPHKGAKFLALIMALAFSLMLGQSARSVALAQAAPHWTYEGEEGPDHWGELSPDYAACSDGLKQSPINIPAGVPVNTSGIVFNYQVSALKISNNGHTIRDDYDPGSSISVEGKTYKLLQFHMHAQSEHTLAGKYSDLELHFVHQSDDGQLAVVGVMINKGAENSAYAAVWSHLPLTVGDPGVVPGVSVDAETMLPADHSYYRYDGSLTTPPCTEGVKWLVLSHPITLSEAQINAFSSIYERDNRPVQPLNGRTFAGGSEGATPGMPRTGENNDDALLLLAAVLAAVALVSSGVVLSRRKADDYSAGN